MLQSFELENYFNLSKFLNLILFAVDLYGFKYLLLIYNDEF